MSNLVEDEFVPYAKAYFSEQFPSLATDIAKLSSMEDAVAFLYQNVSEQEMSKVQEQMLKSPETVFVKDGVETIKKVAPIQQDRVVYIGGVKEGRMIKDNRGYRVIAMGKNPSPSIIGKAAHTRFKRRVKVVHKNTDKDQLIANTGKMQLVEE